MKNKHKIALWAVAISLVSPLLAYASGWASDVYCGAGDVPGIDCGRHGDGMNSVLFWLMWSAGIACFGSSVGTVVLWAIRISLVWTVPRVSDGYYRNDTNLAYWGELDSKAPLPGAKK